MKHVNLIKRLSLWVCMPILLGAQTPAPEPALPVPAMLTSPLVWEKGATSYTHSFSVDDGTQVTCLVALDQRPDRLQFRLPDGTSRNLYEDHQDLAIYRTLPKPGEADYPKSLIRMVGSKIPTGNWILEASFQKLTSEPVGGLVQWVLASPVASIVQAAKDTYLGSEAVYLSLVTTQKGEAIKNTKIQAIVVNEEDPEWIGPTPTFSDQGGDEDPVAQDGQFGAKLTGLQPGNYRLYATVTGTCANGPFARSCHALFKVRPAKITILGNVEEKSVVGGPE